MSLRIFFNKKIAKEKIKMNLKKILLFSVLASTPMLQGCIATTVLAGAAVAGLVIYDSRSSKTMMDDHDISYKSQQIINNDDQLNGYSISVTSFNHVVLLLGEVPNQNLKKHAQDIIKDVPNIKRIYNQITVGSQISASISSNDALITTKVKSALLEEKGLKTTQLKVITENSVVYLMGLTTEEEGNIAATVTQGVSGVKKVVKLFEYISP